MSTSALFFQSAPAPSNQTVKSLRGENMIANDEYDFVPYDRITREGLEDFYISVIDALARLRTGSFSEGDQMSDDDEKHRWGLCIQRIHEAAGFIRDFNSDFYH